MRLSLLQRRFVFFMLLVGGVLIIVAITLGLFAITSNSGRSQPIALLPEVAVGVLAELPDNDAFPAAVALGLDDSVYTGSFASGAVWRIDADGAVTEIPGAREAIGGVSALAVLADGSLLVLDTIDTDARTGGGALLRMLPDGTAETFAVAPDSRGFISPNDLAIDAQGRVYVSDGGRGDVLRFTPSADGTVEAESWWSAPPAPDNGLSSLTGLAYDAGRDALIITDPEVNVVYRVAISDGATETLYAHGQLPNAPGFDGAVVTPDGEVYVAALGQNGIARVNTETGTLDYIAGLFRGSSDIEYQPGVGRFIVPNFDQASLVIPLLSPSLPFTIDTVTLNPEALPEATPPA